MIIDTRQSKLGKFACNKVHVHIKCTCESVIDILFHLTKCQTRALVINATCLFVAVLYTDREQCSQYFKFDCHYDIYSFPRCNFAPADLYVFFILELSLIYFQCKSRMINVRAPPLLTIFKNFQIESTCYSFIFKIRSIPINKQIHRLYLVLHIHHSQPKFSKQPRDRSIITFRV